MGQQGVDFEIIVVDDASTDDTRNFVLEKFGADPRVRLMTLEENSGPAIARNAAFDAARGEWIAVLDADDAIEPDHLRALSTLGENEAADIVAGNFAYYSAPDRSVGQPALSVRSGAERLDLYDFVRGARPYNDDADFGLLKPLFRKDFLRHAAVRYPVDVRHGEDVEMVMFALIAGANYVLHRGTTSYLYTTRDSGFSRTPVDYRSQVRRTRALRRHTKIRRDRKLVDLLDQRADALLRLEFDRNWDNHTVSKAVLASRAVTSSAGRRWLFERVSNKLAR